MKKADRTVELKLTPRPTETVLVKIPKDTLETLKKVASGRDMSH
jgi:hypothetical protein